LCLYFYLLSISIQQFLERSVDVRSRNKTVRSLTKRLHFIMSNSVRPIKHISRWFEMLLWRLLSHSASVTFTTSCASSVQPSFALTTHRIVESEISAHVRWRK